MVSKFSQKCKNWGFGGILPLVLNPAFRSFVKIVIRILSFFQPISNSVGIWGRARICKCNFFFENSSWWSHSLNFVKKISRHCHALNFDQKWFFSSGSSWKRRNGGWIWAISGNNFNPKGPAGSWIWANCDKNFNRNGRKNDTCCNFWLETCIYIFYFIYFYIFYAFYELWYKNVSVSLCLKFCYICHL